MNSVWSPLPCCLSKGLQKRDLLDIYLTTVFGVYNFQNTWAMRVISFWKCSKFNVAFQNAATNCENIFCFCNNCIWINCLELSLLGSECLLSAVNVLRNSIMQFFPTQLSSQWSINMVKVVWFIFRQCFVPSQCCLSKGPLKREFLDIYFTTCFGVRNFENTSTIRVIFLLKIFKI